VNIYLNDDDIRYLPAKEATATADSDELTIIPSIAGGVSERHRIPLLVIRIPCLSFRSAAEESAFVTETVRSTQVL